MKKNIVAKRKLGSFFFVVPVNAYMFKPVSAGFKHIAALLFRSGIRKRIIRINRSAVFRKFVKIVVNKFGGFTR